MPRPHAQNPSREELEDVLRKIVAREFGRRARLTSWHRRISAYSSSCVITRIRVRLDASRGDLQLAFKNLSPGLQLPTARRVRPQFLYDPGREIATYERLLDRLKLGTARYLGNVTVPEQSRYWLFLEWVKGPLLWQMGGMQHWQNAARW